MYALFFVREFSDTCAFDLFVTFYYKVTMYSTANMGKLCYNYTKVTNM